METISLPLAAVIIQLLGLPGAMFIIWYFDHKALARQRETATAQLAAERLEREHQQQTFVNQLAEERKQRDKEIVAILSQYKDDVSALRHLYENNVELVHAYERALERLEKQSSEVLDVISLNTQVQTQLAERLNMVMQRPLGRVK